MKKKIAVISAAAALAMAMTVGAEPSITEIGTVSGDWISGTELLCVESNGLYGITTMDGTALTDVAYGSMKYDMKYGMISVSQTGLGLNCTGVVDLEGNPVVPCQYGEIEILSPDWVVGMVLKTADANQYDYKAYSGNNYYLIDTADVFYVGNGSGQLMATYTREHYMDADTQGTYVQIQDRATSLVNTYDTEYTLVEENLDNFYKTKMPDSNYVVFEENGRRGIKDMDGNVLVEPAYKYIYTSDIRGNLVKVSTGNKYGVIDLEGNVVVPAEYDAIRTKYNGAEDFNPTYSAYYAGGYIAFEQDGKVGFSDVNGNVTCPATLSRDLLDVEGASATYTDLAGATHILAADGVDTVISSDYQRIYALDYCNGLLYRVTNADYDYGLIDWHGNVILPCEYDGINPAGSGNYLIIKPDYYTSLLYSVTYDNPQTYVPGMVVASTGAAVTTVETEGPATVDVPAPVSTNTDAVKQLITSAKTLASLGADTNAGAINSLLNSVLAQLPEGSATATIVSNVITLVETGTADGTTVSTLLDSVLLLLQ